MRTTETYKSITTKMYAVLNFDGGALNGVPYFIETNSKTEMLKALNKFALDFFNQRWYENIDLSEEAKIYGHVNLDHYISDDFCLVTNSKDVFDRDLSLSESYLKVKAKCYKVSRA